MRIENVHILEPHAVQARLQGSQHILARAAHPIGPWPHIPSRFRRDHQLISVIAKILAQNLPEVLLGRPIRWPIVVRQVEVRYAPIERSPDRRPAGLESVDAAEVLPQPQRDRRQYDSRSPAPPKLRSLIPLRIGYKTHL